MYDLDIKEEANRIFKKLAKKDPKQLKIIGKKLDEIRRNPEGYKPLRKPLHGFNRVHIDTSFVLIFQVDHASKIITVFYYAHHDEVYEWRPK